MAPDGAKLSKRIHGPVVSVTTYRDAGFLPHAFVNFLCLLGWSPKNDREKMSREELVELFSLDGINRSNAIINFTDEDPFDPEGRVAERRASPRARSRRTRATLDAIRPTSWLHECHAGEASRHCSADPGADSSVAAMWAPSPISSSLRN